MDYLPVFLDVKGRTILVDGGGTAAARRAERALSVGARVRLYDPAPGPEVLTLVGRAGFTLVARHPVASDFAEVIVAYGASDDPERDQLLYREAKRAGALVNVADVKPLCDFITPSIVDRGAVSIAISTGGTAPIIGRILRARIEAMLPGNYGKLARFLSSYRGKIEETILNGRMRRRFWEKLIEGPVADHFLDGDEARADVMIRQNLQNPTEEGGNITLIELGSDEADLMTFRALRAMQRADLVLHTADTPAGIIGLLRRDATRVQVSDAAVQVAVAAQKNGDRVVWIVPKEMKNKGALEAIFQDLRHANADVRWVPGIDASRLDGDLDMPLYRANSKHELGFSPRSL